MARTLPVPKWDKVTDDKGLLSPKWVEFFEALTGVSGFVFEKPTCFVYFTADQSIGNNAWQDVTFDAEDHDNAAFHSTSTNTDRITIPEAGAYAFGAYVLWDSDAVGIRAIRVLQNATSATATPSDILCVKTVNANVVAGNNPVVVTPTRTRKLSAGDILRTSYFQNSGGALDALGFTSNGPRGNGFWCFKIANAVK